MKDDTKMDGINHPIAMENEEHTGSNLEQENEVKKDVAEEEKVKPEIMNSQEVEKFLTEAQQNGDESPSPETSISKWHKTRIYFLY